MSFSILNLLLWRFYELSNKTKNSRICFIQHFTVVFFFQNGWQFCLWGVWHFLASFQHHCNTCFISKALFLTSSRMLCKERIGLKASPNVDTLLHQQTRNDLINIFRASGSEYQLSSLLWKFFSYDKWFYNLISPKQKNLQEGVITYNFLLPWKVNVSPIPHNHIFFGFLITHIYAHTILAVHACLCMAETLIVCTDITFTNVYTHISAMDGNMISANRKDHFEIWYYKEEEKIHQVCITNNSFYVFPLIIPVLLHRMFRRHG